METAHSIDIPTTIMVALALVTSLTASYFAWKFASTVGGEMGGAFRWVMIGVIIFAVTRADDLCKVAGIFASMGIDYGKFVLLPHSLAVFVAWILITVGFYKMDKAFGG
jgi:hypothetical protein